MPEGPEIRIMSDFINKNTHKKIFKNIYLVEKGNNPVCIMQDNQFKIESSFYGKKLILNVILDEETIPIFVFMGMSGNWKFTKTEDWAKTKFTRLRFDTEDDNSLLLYGGYLGPKYSFYTNFKNSRQGFDPILDFDKFEDHIINSINHKDFKKPIFELLLDQKYFAGIGNYLRSTILYYADVNPFDSSKSIIENNPNFLKLCKDIMEESYRKNGGQLRDWENPFDVESSDFNDWVYYQKGNKIKDSQDRTFWYNPKWQK